MSKDFPFSWNFLFRWKFETMNKEVAKVVNLLLASQEGHAEIWKNLVL
jgi:hypothetical protein